MHMLECLYILDYFDEDEIRDINSNIEIYESGDSDYAVKEVVLELEKEVMLVLNLGLYAKNDAGFNLECHIYVVKEGVWLEEYDMIYLNRYQAEAKYLGKFVQSIVNLIRDEIKEKSLPIKVYETIKQKIRIANNVTEKEKEEILVIADEFERNELPAIREEYESMVVQEIERDNQEKAKFSKSTDEVLVKSLVRFYEKQVDKALVTNDKELFLVSSESYIYYKNKLKKMYL